MLAYEETFYSFSITETVDLITHFWMFLLFVLLNT